MLKVGVLGSCRVDTPIRIMADRGLCELRRNQVFGYSHTTREFLQQIGYLQGRLGIPTALSRGRIA